MIKTSIMSIFSQPSNDLEETEENDNENAINHLKAKIEERKQLLIKQKQELQEQNEFGQELDQAIDDKIQTIEELKKINTNLFFSFFIFHSVCNRHQILQETRKLGKELSNRIINQNGIIQQHKKIGATQDKIIQDMTQLGKEQDKEISRLKKVRDGLEQRALALSRDQHF